MNKRTDQEALLADVLAEEFQEGFGVALLGETLRHARRRRRWRQTRQAGGVMLLVLVAGFAVWQTASRRIRQTEVAQPQTAPLPYQLIVSQPLPASQLVTTQPLAREPLLMVEFTTPVIRTYGSGIREVGDDELLALAAPQTAALIRRGPHEAELVLVSADERTTLREN